MLLATSVYTIAPDGDPDEDVIDVLAGLAGDFDVGVLSNRPEPKWLKKALDGTDIDFVHLPGRRDGKALRKLARDEGVPRHQVIVLAGSRDDIAMAANAGAVLVGAGWVDDKYVAKTGLRVDEPEDFAELVDLVDGWAGEHWFQAKGSEYSVDAICDLSTLYKGNAQQQFGRAVTDAVKGGGHALNGLLTIASCVLVHGGIRERRGLLWGVYPSSASSNDDTDTLSEFGHRLRTSVSRVQMAREGEPLFLRHKPTVKRSANANADRTDPVSEVESIRLNPAYRGKIAGKNVVVLDDCTTYGISMATAAGFLRRAGASSVTCLAIGKFGNCLGYYEVTIKSDPFAPVSLGDWSSSEGSWVEEQRIVGAQVALRELLET